MKRYPLTALLTLTLLSVIDLPLSQQGLKPLFRQNQTQTTQANGEVLMNQNDVQENSNLGQAQERMPLNENPYTIHIISHSHQDAGWIQTIDEYFNSDVSKIYTNVMNALIMDETKTFTHAEIYFFKMWWELQTEDTKTKFKKLVKDGRWEFVNGGWVASDEACPNFQDLMQNILVGHSFLWREFQVVPKIAWHADAFGHSKGTARTFLNMGYEAMFFARVSDTVRNTRKSQRNFEFMWQPEFESPEGKQVKGSDDGLLSHIMYRHYNVPCSQVTIQGFFNKNQMPSLYDNQKANFRQNSQSIVSCLTNAVNAYKTKNFMWVLGEDFSFLYAQETYELMDVIINSVQKISGDFVFKYSTVNEYVAAVKDELQEKSIKLDVHKGDFFPLYEIWKDVHWNGYYTGRPNFKKFLRDLSSLAYESSSLFALQIFQQINATQTKFLESKVNQSQSLLQATSLAMHHDTITGTSQIRVINDQNQRFQKALTESQTVLISTINDLVKQQGFDLKENVISCQAQLNERPICPSTQDKVHQNLQSPTYFTVYNPSFFEKTHTELSFSHARVYVSVWNPASKSFDFLTDTEIFCYKNQDSVQECDLHINDVIPPQSLRIYKVSNKIGSGSQNKLQQVQNTTEVKISSDKIQLSLIEKSDQILRFQYVNKLSQDSQRFDFQFMQYQAYQNKSYQNSGPYIFKSNLDHAIPYEHKIIDIQTFNGQNFQKFLITYQDSSNMLSIAKIKLHKSSENVEFDVFFARIPNSQQGYDVVATWKAYDIDGDGLFYTDSNALGLVRRTIDEHKNDYRNSFLRPSGNYYPVNSAVMIEDIDNIHQMIVMNDRPQAGTAFDDNRIELMFNRRSYSNDDMGMVEPLNEVDSHGQGLNVSVKFHLKFTHSRTDAFASIARQYSLTTQPAIILISDQAQPNQTQTQRFDITTYNDLLSQLKTVQNDSSIYEFSMQLQIDGSLFVRVTSWDVLQIKQVKNMIEIMCKRTNFNQAASIVNSNCGNFDNQYQVTEVSLDGDDELRQKTKQSKSFDGTLNVQMFKVVSKQIKELNLNFN
eukprot:403341261